MTSRAHQLFRQIVDAADPAQVLSDTVSSQRTETEFLEFKGGRVQKDQTKAKGLWSQALSGFANTEGGVLIWGIRAARIEHPDDPSRKIDAANDLDLVSTPATFAQLLKDVQLEACVEPVQGVDIVDIDAGEGDGSGFVVCLIPEGDHKPYRAGIDPAKQYYQRIGDNFVVIPHSLLRSLFYPRFAPLLCICMWPTYAPTNEPVERLQFFARIENHGSASAKEAYVTCQGLGDDCFHWGAAWEPRRGFAGHSTGMKCLHTLHPKEVVEIGTIGVPPTGTEGGRPSITGGLKCKFTVFLADNAPQTISVEFNSFEIAYNRPEKTFYPEDSS